MILLHFHIFNCDLQAVPIPIITNRCSRNCCTRTFVPLELAYARSIHKFQGMTVGPTKPGQPPNMYSTIICDPDDRRFEGMWPGLLYTMVSRATTLGDDSGVGSAIYFDAPLVGSIPLTTERLSNLLYKTKRTASNKEPELYENVKMRQDYVAKLRSNLFVLDIDEEEVLSELLRVEEMRVPDAVLDSKIDQYSFTLYLKNEAP